MSLPQLLTSSFVFADFLGVLECNLDDDITGIAKVDMYTYIFDEVSSEITMNKIIAGNFLVDYFVHL